MSFTTRTKITAIFASVVSILIILLNLMIFESSNKEWQTKKTEYMDMSMETMLSVEEAKKMFFDLQVESGSGEIVFQQGLFTHNMQHESIGSWLFDDLTITRANERYYYWGIKTNPDGYIYKTIDDVTDIIVTRNMIIERALWLSFSGFLLLIIIGHTFSGYVLRPIQNMNEATRKFSLSEKEGSPRVGIYGNIKDEVVILARSLEELFTRVNKEAERLEQFSDDIAHEIKNKIFEIMSSLDVALSSDSSHDSIQKAKDLLKQLSNVVDALLFFARNDVKDPENIKIATFLKAHFSKQDTRIVFREEANPTVAIYGELFLTAIGNIVSNAQKYTPQDGVITIVITKAGIDISDTGLGIPQEHLPHIFDRLYKVDRSRSGGGYGIGLSISKKILEELHHMTITVKSVEGKGTIFSIVW